MIETAHRSNQKEIMDDLEMQGEELEKTLLDLDKVNRWLGGNNITLEGVKKLLKNIDKTRPVRIIDVGCGNGTILKEVAEFGRKREYRLELLGIDANRHSMQIAQKNLIEYPEIGFKAMDVFSNEFKIQEADIILCTLTLHHFNDEQIKELMTTFTSMAGLGVVVNDLRRSKTAYYLFQAFCTAFKISDINRQDGLTSILRSFKRSDLEKYGEHLNVRLQEINSKWAFRYQWILFK